MDRYSEVPMRSKNPDLSGTPLKSRWIRDSSIPLLMPCHDDRVTPLPAVVLRERQGEFLTMPVCRRLRQVTGSAPGKGVLPFWIQSIPNQHKAPAREA